MTDLIDRAALGIGRKNPLVFDKVEYAHGWNCAVEIIQNAMAVDAVEVVRCKDCKYKRITNGAIKVKSYNCDCTLSPCRGRIVEPPFFCPYGEEEKRHETD